MSFWDLMGAEKSDNPKSLLELEARQFLMTETNVIRHWKQILKEKIPQS